MPPGCVNAMTDWISKKLLFALLIVVAATVLAGMDKISAEQWIEIVKYVGLGYLGVQGGLDVTSRIVNRRNGGAPPPVRPARKKKAAKKS